MISKPHNQKPLINLGSQSTKGCLLTMCVNHHVGSQEVLFKPAISCKPMLYLRLPVFQWCFNVSKNQICKKIVYAADVCDGPGISCDVGPFRFGNNWNSVLCQAHGIARFLKIVFMMLRMVHQTFSGAKWNNSATKPHSSEALFAFIRLIAFLNSCKLQSASVS